MNKRENLLSLIRRQGFKEVPVQFDLCPILEEKYRKEIKSELTYYEYFGFPWCSVSDLKLPDYDTKKYSKYFNPPVAKNGAIDIWGIGHEPTENSMHMSHMRHPLEAASTLEELKEYPFPDYKNADGSHQKAEVEAILKRGLASVGYMATTIWETSWYLRSMEELMMDMMTDDEKAWFIFDKVTELAVTRAKSYAAAGVDILYLGDDIGMQSSIMMSEDIYCRFIKPSLKKVIDEARKIKPDILVFYHSCGFVIPFIPHLIEVGIDVLNPIQPESMNFREIYEEFGDKISFHGTIGTQSVMPFGTVEEVKRAVFENLTIAGEKGGLFPAPTHILEPEVPWENIIAYVEACREFKL